MSFLYPAFLWAFAVLSIPIIIHLFNFRKTTRIYFSNTRFLKQAKQVTKAKRKLKHYLILASRLLMLAMLVLVFAQPIIPAKEQLGARTHVIVYLDNSFSMSAQLDNKNRALDEGIGFIQHILDIFPADSRYKFITNDFAPFSNTFKTKVEVSDLLTQVRLSPVSRRAEEIINRVGQETQRQVDDVFWISDFQRSTMGLLPELSIQDSAIEWHLVPLTPELNSNVFIDTVYLENPFAVGEEKNAIKVRVRNDGTKQVEQLNLKMTINDIQAATTSLNIEGKSVNEATFDLTTGLKGINQAQISFNDFPVSFDNEFFVSLNFSDKVNVLEIKSSANLSPIGRVFGNQEVFSYRGFSVDNFNYSLLNQADLVVLNNLNAIDEALIIALNEYQNNFGTLLIVPGDDPDLEAYHQLTQVLLSAPRHGYSFELDGPDFDNPFFENVFEEKTRSIAMPKAIRVWEWGGDRSAILKFKNGEPYLSLFQRHGKTYLMASPITEDFTDLHRNAIFVPVMYRIAASSKRHLVKPYYTLDENFISLKTDSIFGEEPFRLVGHQEIIPAQRKIRDRVMLDIPKYSMAQGFYQVVMQGDTVDQLAFNLTKEESLMERLDTQEVLEAFGANAHVGVLNAQSQEAFRKEIKDKYLGIPLWKYALVLALFFLLVEILLVRFMK